MPKKSLIHHDIVASWQELIKTLSSWLNNSPVFLIQYQNGFENYSLLCQSDEKLDFMAVGNKKLSALRPSSEVYAQRHTLIENDLSQEDSYPKSREWLSGAIKSYMGIPLFWPDGIPFGELCIMNVQPNQFSEYERSIAQFVSQNIELRLEVLYNQRTLNRVKTSFKLQKSKMMEIANTDVLTKLNNRRHFMEIAKKECERAHRKEQPVSVMMIDLDHFKSINDTFGHAAGDQVLRNFSRALKRFMRKSDILGRLGGEEFTVVLIGQSSEEAMKIAKRLNREVSQRAVNFNEQNISYTVSIGVAESSEEHHTISQLLNAADEALYDAKNSGRNRCCLYK